jgi:hypothetical protein
MDQSCSHALRPIEPMSPVDILTAGGPIFFLGLIALVVVYFVLLNYLKTQKVFGHLDLD